MPRELTPEAVRAAASLIELEIDDAEVIGVTERLAMMFDAYEQFAHLTESTAELDAHFDAKWETESA
jgi:hypothetical protein